MPARLLMLGCLLGLSVSAMAEDEPPPPPPPPSFHAGVRFVPEDSVASHPAVSVKKPVLIYYANDVRTRYTKGFDLNARALAAALEKHPTDDDATRVFLTNLSQRILTDIDDFNTAVDDERDALVEGFIGTNLSHLAGLAIFRNYGNPVSLDDRGWEVRIPWECSDPQHPDQGLTRKTMTLFVDKEFMGHPFWPSQPLTSPYALITALEAVKLVFPEDTHRYLLVIKSRGDKDHFLLPWWEGEITSVEPSRLVGELLKHRAELAAEDGRSVREGRQIYESINAVLRAHDPEPPPLRHLSLRKDQLLEMLARLGGGDPRRGVYFPVLVADTFDGELEQSQLPILQELVKPGDYRNLNLRNIDAFYARRDPRAGQPLPYEKLFSPFGVPGVRTNDFSEKFAAWLTMQAKEDRP